MRKPALEIVAGETLTLIPNSGVQFLDFGLDAGAMGRLSRAVTWIGSEEDGPEVAIYPVHPGQDDTRVYRPKGSEAAVEVDEDCTYSLRAETALDRFDRQWLPFPFFRRSEEGFDEGPTTWARVQVVRLAEPEPKGHTHRVVLAFDTLLTPRLPGQPYTAPQENDDAIDKVSFGFCDDHDANFGFMSLPWVSGWLREAYAHGLTRETGRKVSPEALPRPGEHWAAYMALLDALKAGIVFPSIELVNIFAGFGRSRPVGVSLVLDVGNSRMCGVLIETARESGFADFGHITRLELRDLSRVEEVYSDPFESRIEFSAPGFGPLHHAIRSQRVKRDAFYWPSPVRVGPEAARLAALTDGTEGASGLSSPKRYLWDGEARPQPWINNAADLAPGAEAVEIGGPIVSRLTESGERVSRRKGALPGLMRRYSRSSLYTLMLCELLIHALTQINSADMRRNRPDSGSPRRLQQIILTLPTATPVAEQKIMRSRIRDAVELVWDVMGLSTPMPDGQPMQDKPEVRLDWDEATCTHLVWLYNEISTKFGGKPREFFDLVAQRPADPSRLRVASIDIGGGTTDLMIIEHVIKPGTDSMIQPAPVFREGFRLAGDDILKEVIQSCLLPDIAAWLATRGVAAPDRLMAQLFGGNREGTGQRERTMRAQLVVRVLSAAAVGLLKRYETAATEPGEALRLGDLLPADAVVAEPALAWFSEQLRLASGSGQDIRDAVLRLEPQRIERLITGLVGPMIENLCDLVRCHGCDMLLVSGRPSQFPVFRRLIEAAMPVPADRIVSMGQYRVGNWYPFHSDDFRIRDPKTTAVVGAMLVHICSQSASGMTLATDRLKMRSTARFIGRMDTSGRIPEADVLLHNVDLDNGRGLGDFTLAFESNGFIGYRQLPLARWPGSPLYALRLREPKEKTPPPVLPVKVTLERMDPGGTGDEDPPMEDFRITHAEDAMGEDCTRKIAFRLQTLVIETQAEAGYWLDTGIVEMRSE